MGPGKLDRVAADSEGFFMAGADRNDDGALHLSLAV
jgi:hypothetical protein